MRGRQSSQSSDKRTAAGPTWATGYTELAEHIAVARHELDADNRGPVPWEERRARQRRLINLLEVAVAQAFAADAAGAPTPLSVKTWVGEGLARSTERELAIIAGIDVG